jgi:hypothetical protein
MYFTYDEYIERWDEIAAIFSREAVWKGALDRYAESSKGKKGTTEVDDEFLKDMNEWRVALARNIALRNPQVKDEQQLNYAVQMTIDRIIFLRICEDRGIEPEEQLKTIASAPNIYANLLELFRRADLRYNSGLFNFTHDKDDNTPPDAFTPTLSIDDRVLREIIRHIYYPCPYIFKEIPVEILGQVYEQFLGQVIRLTAGHQAKVEEKPEVRKAGGVYYTPRYIVDYIVENTVGKLLEGKTPEQAAQLKIVDPACGSGSFLLGAFQYLIDWHEQWYLANDPAKWAKGKNPALVEITNGWKLTTLKKKEILINNLHGVDIDPQAVEVTKLSLLLKVLEEESGQLSLGLERALPDLGRNIQCGNSLIGEDYFAGQLVVDDAERRRVNPFEWRDAFPQVFAQGGFDAVIGNPPYIRIQAMKEWAPGEVEFYKKQYKSASKGNYDIYVVFIEKGAVILNQNGFLGFIVPHKFMNAKYGEPIRSVISAGKKLKKIVHFSDQQVFQNATTYTCLIFLQNSPLNEFELESISNIDEWKIFRKSEKGVIEIDSVSEKEWNFQTGNDTRLFNKLNQVSTKLGDISKMFVGLQTSADTIFLFKKFSRQDDWTVLVQSKELEIETNIESDILRQVVRSGDIGRYWARPSALVLFPYERDGGRYSLIPYCVIRAHYPLAWKYLLKNEKVLSEREHGKFNKSGWYQLYPKNLDLWEQPKIMIPYMVRRLSAYYDVDNLFFVNVTTGGFGLTLSFDDWNPKYVIGLLNSKLLNWFFIHVSSTFHGGYYAANKQFLVQLPLIKIEKVHQITGSTHNQIIVLVDRMLDLHKQTPATPQEHEQLQRQIAATDRQIDTLVYQLYGLTDDEIALVEGS